VDKVQETHEEVNSVSVREIGDRRRNAQSLKFCIDFQQNLGRPYFEGELEKERRNTVGSDKEIRLGHKWNFME